MTTVDLEVIRERVQRLRYRRLRERDDAPVWEREFLARDLPRMMREIVELREAVKIARKRERERCIGLLLNVNDAECDMAALILAKLTEEDE